MNLKFQAECIEELQQLSNRQSHSILITGPVGCGKSYLAHQYANMIGAASFISVKPAVQEIRNILDSSYDTDALTVFCIENLDTGVLGASYTLLKWLEEPASNVYIIVTCRNRYAIPDTIISRCACINLPGPIKSDVDNYAMIRDITKYESVKELDIWQAVRTLQDVDNILNLSPTRLQYLISLQSVCKFSDSVSNLVWQLGHFDDDSETDVSFVINYIIHISNSDRILKYGISCIQDLTSARIAPHAVLAKFVFDCKYGE